jgi:TPR repeat protein
LHFGRYAQIPEYTDPPGQAAWAFARYHLAPNRKVGEAALEAHQAGVPLGTFVLLLCHRSGAGVLHDEATADRLNYELRTRLEQLDKPSSLELFMHSNCLAGDERGIVEHTLAEGLSWKKSELERRIQRQQAADAGFAQACAEVAGDYQKQGKTEEAFRWFRTAAALGLAEGMRGAGFLLTGRPVTDEHTRNGVDFTRQGAEAGDAFAMINLAVFHARGLVVPRSTEQAQGWLDRAAATGHWAGLIEKGTALLRGSYEYPVSEAEGKRLLQEAVQTGHSDLLWRLARFYGEGFGLRKNLELSIRFAEAAFRQGNREAAKGLAGLYHRGYESIAPNEELARFWTIQSRVDTAFAMGPKLEDSPLLQRLWAIDPFALQVE